MLGANGGIIGYNLFAYCNNNPVMFVDAEGTCTLGDMYYHYEFAEHSLSVGSVCPYCCKTVDDMYFAHPKEWSDLAEKYPQYSGKQISDLIRCQVKTQTANIKIRASVTKPIQTASAVHCFVAGTLVKTKDGDKAIENVCVGDYVWAFDPETGEVALKMVLRTFVNETDELIIVKIGDEIIEPLRSIRFMF